MTAKRFTHKKWYDERQLFDGEEAFAIVDSGTQASIICNRLNKLSDENEQLKKQLKELKEDVPLLLAFYRWYPFAVEKKEHQAYNRLWDFVND